MFKYNQYILSDIIQFVMSSGFKETNFCIYSNSTNPLNLIDEYWISDYPEVINDKDIYPYDVRSKSLNLVYHGKNFVDVICSTLAQKPDATEDELLAALIYYSQHKTFMKF
ncbi:TPA: hypothetical protein QB352_000328 [Pasteurella multocida]|nr:hypothetical protein [Pasteurella multocida]